jgi:hypothetical protein
MTTSSKLLAFSAFVLLLAGTTQVSAQHTIRRASHAASYRTTEVQHAGEGHRAAGCSGCQSRGVRQHDSCGGCQQSCCSPCIKLCLPNPCRVVDRVGTALSGLKDLFCCQPCCNSCTSGCAGGCSDCNGVIRGEIPYLEHQQQMVPHQPALDAAPTPPPATSAGRSILKYSATPRTSAQEVRAQRYQRTGSVQQVQGLRRVK